jgi:hypothetical protein
MKISKILFSTVLLGAQLLLPEGHTDASTRCTIPAVGGGPVAGKN